MTTVSRDAVLTDQSQIAADLARDAVIFDPTYWCPRPRRQRACMRHTAHRRPAVTPGCVLLHRVQAARVT